MKIKYVFEINSFLAFNEKFMMNKKNVYGHEHPEVEGSLYGICPLGF